MQLILNRVRVDRNATIGSLVVPGYSHPLWTLEDLWRENEKQVSCIPAGDYHCAPHGWGNEPVKFKRVWEVLNVPGRSAILLHAGNTDADTLGCIMVGKGVNGDKITHSRDAIALLRELIGRNEFDLQIRDIASA